jgi:hypothetical protein
VSLAIFAVGAAWVLANAAAGAWLRRKIVQRARETAARVVAEAERRATATEEAAANRAERLVATAERVASRLGAAGSGP